jgi:hypothetical protein
MSLLMDASVESLNASAVLGTSFRITTRSTLASDRSVSLTMLSKVPAILVTLAMVLYNPWHGTSGWAQTADDDCIKWCSNENDSSWQNK